MKKEKPFPGGNLKAWLFIAWLLKDDLEKKKKGDK